MPSWPALAIRLPLLVTEVDGCDPVASYRAMSGAIAHARAGRGPALVHAHCIRPYSHSMSDDQRLYRTEAEIDAERARDPLETFPRRLVEEGTATEAELEALRKEVDAEIEEAAEKALLAPWPEKTREAAEAFVFSPDVDPTSSDFDTAPEPEGKPINMIDCINRVLLDEMERDARVLVFGEDVADATRADALKEVKGKGGVFKSTHGLQRAHGALSLPKTWKHPPESPSRPALDRSAGPPLRQPPAPPMRLLLDLLALVRSLAADRARSRMGGCPRRMATPLTYYANGVSF